MIFGMSEDSPVQDYEVWIVVFILALIGLVLFTSSS